MPAAPSSLALSARYALVSAGTFATIGIFMPFWPLWLESRGLTPGEIGILLAVNVWVRVPTGPLVGHLADLGGSPKFALVAASAACLFAFALFLFPGGFWQLLILQALAATALNAMIPLCESLTMQAVRRRDLIYGRIRIWGSLAFITAAFGGGAMIAPEDAGIVLWLLLAALTLSTLANLALPNEGRRSGPRRIETRWLDLLRHRNLLRFLVAAAVLQSSHALLYGFSSLYWTASGISAGEVGALWAIGTAAEIVLFWMSARLVGRLTPPQLLLVASTCGVLRWSLFAMTTELPLLALGQLLHAGTFGITHLAAMNMITDSAPPDRIASVQTLYSGVVGGLAMGAMMLLSGDLYEWAGGQAFFAMAMVSVAGAALALPLLASRER